MQLIIPFTLLGLFKYQNNIEGKLKTRASVEDVYASTGKAGMEYQVKVWPLLLWLVSHVSLAWSVMNISSGFNQYLHSLTQEQHFT